MKRLLLLVCHAVLLAAAARADEPLWFPDEVAIVKARGGTQGAQRIAAEAHPFQAWTSFADLDPRKSATVSCRLDFEGPLKPESKTQLRWGLFGRQNDQWTGVSIVAGTSRDAMCFEIWATQPTATNVLSTGSNQRLGELSVKGTSPTAGAPVRLAMTVRQNADGTCDVSGLLGTHAFEFKGQNLGHPLPALNTFGIMNCKNSGVPGITVSRLRAGN